MLEYYLNIAGGEWMIIIFVALIVLLGTNRMPDLAKKLGRAVGEYHKTKNEVEQQFKEYTGNDLKVTGPVQNERQKLETIAKSLGIDYSAKSDEELRQIISSKIGRPESQSSTQTQKS